MLRNEDSNTTRHMCRRLTGVNYGYACDEHALRCVICACSSKIDRPVKVCDDCASRKTMSSNENAKPHRKCIVCDVTIRSEEPQTAHYCQYCVMLERDRDGCPTTMGTLQQKKDNALRLANITIN